MRKTCMGYVRLWCGLAIFSLSGCMMQANNGDTFSGSNVNRSVSFSGYYTVAGATIELKVMEDPTAAIPVWTTLATTTTSTTDTSLYGESLYAWSVSAVLVPSSSRASRWPAGGVARVKAMSGSHTLFSFNADWADCWNETAPTSSVDFVSDCQSNASPVVGLVDTDPIPAASGFLSFRGGSLATAASETEAEQYYAAIDAGPSDQRRTLSGWLSANGFPGGVTTATYFNAGDLEFGRQMHCRTKKLNLFVTTLTLGYACYVGNYASVDDAVTSTGIIATVAMEANILNPGPNDVRFYAYDATGNILTQVSLDSEGGKAFPQLCLACHGGHYNAATHEVTEAHFLPFDVSSFEYASASGYQLDDQQQDFRKLNHIVKQTGPDSAITALIDGWYASTGGVVTPGATADEGFVPSGWSSHPDVYQKVVAPYCRMCHVALGSGKHFDSYREFEKAPIESYVCNAHMMPHAEVTYHRFWQSGARAHLLLNLDIASVCN